LGSPFVVGVMISYYPLEKVWCVFFRYSIGINVLSLFMVKDSVDRELSRVFKNVSWWGWLMGLRWIWGVNWGLMLSWENIVVYYYVVFFQGSGGWWCVHGCWHWGGQEG
jgi:hypothetical protein